MNTMIKSTPTQVTGMLKAMAKFATHAAQIQVPQQVPDAAVAYLEANLCATEQSGVNKHLCKLIDNALHAGHLCTGSPVLVRVLRAYQLQKGR